MRRLVWITTAVVFAIGCTGGGGPILPVNGIVTLDGQPISDVTVHFRPESGAGTSGFAKTGTDGKFVIIGGKGERGLQPGQYKVTVSKLKPIDSDQVGAVTEADIKDDFPAIYSHPERTILAFSVTGDGKPIEIKLDSKRKK